MARRRGQGKVKTPSKRGKRRKRIRNLPEFTVEDLKRIKANWIWAFRDKSGDFINISDFTKLCLGVVKWHLDSTSRQTDEIVRICKRNEEFDFRIGNHVDVIVRRIDDIRREIARVEEKIDAEIRIPEDKTALRRASWNSKGEET